MSESPGETQIKLRPMSLADLEEIEYIDRVSFPTPWPKDAFVYELKYNRRSICYVAELHAPQEQSVIVGSIVIWLVADEAHIGTLAIRPGFRQHGMGRMLLAQSLLECVKAGATQALLEVRVSNVAAQELYRKFGFTVVGRRREYYQDTHEDALLMTLALLDDKKLADLAKHR